jgi:hypothetical protein
MAEPRVLRLELPFFAVDFGVPLRLLVPVKLGAPTLLSPNLKVSIEMPLRRRVRAGLEELRPKERDVNHYIRMELPLAGAAHYTGWGIEMQLDAPGNRLDKFKLKRLTLCI